MAITESRMLSLIAAAAEYAAAYERLARAIASANGATLEDYRLQVNLALADANLRPSLEAYSTLMWEQRHFEKARAINARARNRMAARRAGQGGAGQEPQYHAPSNEPWAGANPTTDHLAAYEKDEECEENAPFIPHSK